MTALAAALTASIALAPPADARGCIKGAVVGGVAGHYVGRGHALAGAAVGCIAGRHLARKRAMERRTTRHR
jgi:outer membrane lipoprotein SlyB